jgi:hypothetical protein
MPNWCSNTLEIKGPTKKLEEFSKTIKDGEGFFNTILPLPKQLEETTSPTPKDSNQPLIDGANNWYDWRVNNWGTKWDVDGEDSFYTNELKDFDTLEDGTERSVLTLAFDTAWSPPEGIFEELSRQGFGIKAYYYEPGMDFAGRWEDGDDEGIQVHDYKHDDKFWTEGLGKELDEEFNICEEMAQYDEDEEEADKKNEELKKAEVPNE